MPKVDSKLIAKLAGVSRSTVSRVLNEYSDISENNKRKWILPKYVSTNISRKRF